MLNEHNDLVQETSPKAVSVWIEVDTCMARGEVKYTQHQESRVVYSPDLRARSKLGRTA